MDPITMMMIAQFFGQAMGAFGGGGGGQKSGIEALTRGSSSKNPLGTSGAADLFTGQANADIFSTNAGGVNSIAKALGSVVDSGLSVGNFIESRRNNRVSRKQAKAQTKLIKKTRDRKALGPDLIGQLFGRIG